MQAGPHLFVADVPKRRLTLFVLFLFGCLCSAAMAVAGTTATRPYPYPNYRVGQNAVLQITTSPVQANQPVYRWRYKNGLRDGSQPTYIGTTDANGTLTNSYTLQATDVGAYTREKFAVGSTTAPTTSERSFNVHAASAPTAFRPSPYPYYQVGQTARLELSTSPAQPHQKVYRFRYKDGQADGAQPTLLGWTDASGRLVVQATVTTHEIGQYTGEQYAVGTVGGPRSPSVSYYVSASTAPTVSRPAPYPSYKVGDTATVQLSTHPPQPSQKVYRSHRKDGVWSNDVLVGWTSSSGTFTSNQTLDASDVGDYAYETYRVGTILGPPSSALAYEVSAPVPAIHSISSDLVPQGSITELTLYGEHLDDTVVSVDGIGTLPLVSVVSGTDTSLRVAIDARAPGIQGYFTLKAENGAGWDRAAFEVAPRGPTVNAFSPAYPERGTLYVLMMIGHNLKDVTVTSSDPEHVRVMIPQADSRISTTFDQPVDASVADDQSLQGILEIADDAPLGPVQLQVRDAAGGVTVLQLEVEAGGGAAASGANQISLRDVAAAKSGASSSSLPNLQLQDFQVEQALSLGKIGDLEPVGDCASSATFFALRQQAWVQTLGDAGRVLTTASLLLGQPYNFEVMTFSAYVGTQASFYWNCDPDFDETELYWSVFIGFDWVGVFSAEFMVRSDNGRVVWAGEVDSIFNSYSFDDPSNNCMENTPLVESSGTNLTVVQQNLCCPSELPVSFSAGVHPNSPFLGGTLIALEWPFLDTEPDAQQCPCWVAGDWQGKTSPPPECPGSDLFIKAVEFKGDHEIYKDQLGSAPKIMDPVWEDDNLDQSPEKNDSVAYTAGATIELEATFNVEPTPIFPKRVHVRGTSPEGFVFEDSSVQISGSSVSVTMSANEVLPSATKHFDPLAIDWQFSEDGTTFYDAGQSRHELFVILKDPLTSLSKIFLTTLHLAIGNGGATSETTAFDRTWESFSTGGGPANIVNWNGDPLRYYPQLSGLGDCASSSEELLTGAGGGFAGQCASFAFLLIDALAINGIDSTFTRIETSDGHNMLVKNFDRGAPTLSHLEYQWRLDLVNEGSGRYGMVPPPPMHQFGDLRSLQGLPGQNSPMPSEKGFGRHFVVKVPTKGNSAYDPSYGTIYADEPHFEATVLEGYFARPTGLILPLGSFAVKPAPSATTRVVFR